MADRFDKLTERARRVLIHAQEEAYRFNHNHIGTEHILLGLVREDEGVAAQVLKNLRVELNKVRDLTEFIMGRGDRRILGEIELTPRAKKIIELAVDEARRMEHSYVGTEHILIGLIREVEGIGAGVLESFGVNLEIARSEVRRVLDDNRSRTAPKTLAEMSDEELDAAIAGLMEAWKVKIDEMTTAFHAFQIAGDVKVARQKERDKKLLPPENEDQSGQNPGDESD